MVLGWSKATVSPIAVDFGADSLKLLQVVPGRLGSGSRGGGRPRLIAAASAVMPESARCDPSQRFGFYTQSLKLLLKSQNFKGRRAICSVPAFQTLVHHLQISRGESGDHATILDHIGVQLRQRLNVDPTRVVIRYFDAGAIVRDGVPKQEFICAAVGQDVVMRYLAIAESAKLQVVGMHCEQYAIMRAFSHLDQGAGLQREKKSTCFIDFGASTTKVVITHSMESPDTGDTSICMGLAKTIHAGGDHLNRHYAKQAGLSFIDARAARVRQAGDVETDDTQTNVQCGKDEVTQGLAAAAIRIEEDSMAVDAVATGAVSTSVESATISTGTKTTIVAPAVVDSAVPSSKLDFVSAESRGSEKTGRPIPAADETIECIIDELRMSTRYYQSLFPERTIDRLVFLGGESQHTRLCQEIARASRIGAQRGDPMANLHGASNRQHCTGVDMTQPQPGWAVPLGLCLSEVNL